MSDFDELDRILGVEDAGSLTRQRPWIEDQFAASEALGEMYEKLGLKRPKTVWASSPRVLHEAIEMLRNVFVGQRHKFIDAMVPYDPDTLRREAQKTTLEALLERDLTVTMGAALQRQIPYIKTGELGRLSGYLVHALRPQNLQRNTAPAGWADCVLYSVGLPSMVLQSQTFCICPFVRIAWMCSPGKKQLTEEATIWTWSDGYTVVVPHEEPKEEDEQPKTLEGGTYGEIDRKKFGDLTTPTLKSTPRLLEGK